MRNLIIIIALMFVFLSTSANAGTYSEPMADGALVMGLDEAYYQCYNKPQTDTTQKQFDCLQNARERYSKEIGYFIESTKANATSENDLNQYIKYVNLLSSARDAGLATLKASPHYTDYRATAVDAVNLFAIKTMFDTMALFFEQGSN